MSLHIVKITLLLTRVYPPEHGPTDAPTSKRNKAVIPSCLCCLATIHYYIIHHQWHPHPP